MQCFQRLSSPAGHQNSSSQVILYYLQPVNVFGRSAVQQTVAVVESRRYQAAGNRLGHVGRYEWPDVTQGSQVVVAAANDAAYVLVKRYGRVNGDAE